MKTVRKIRDSRRYGRTWEVADADGLTLGDYPTLRAALAEHPDAQQWRYRGNPTADGIAYLKSRMK